MPLQELIHNISESVTLLDFAASLNYLISVLHIPLFICVVILRSCIVLDLLQCVINLQWSET
jgi:hypothetical protein